MRRSLLRRPGHACGRRADPTFLALTASEARTIRCVRVSSCRNVLRPERTSIVMNQDYSQQKFETRCVHVGVAKDDTFNSCITPIYPTSTFRFEALGKTKGYDYTRSGNPTRRV